MLKEIILKECYKVKQNGVFAVQEDLHKERELNANELIPEIEKDISEIEFQITKTEETLDNLKKDLSDRMQLLNEILFVYKKIPKRLLNGIAEQDENGNYKYEYVKKVGA